MLFGILASISSAVLLISNLAAGKLWDLFGIAVDGGIIIFPLTYIIGDLIVGLYGKRKADIVALVSACLCALMALTMLVVVKWLPAFPDWENQTAFETVFGSVNRVTFGSLIGYLLSNLLNNHVFVKIRHGFIGKALGSSVVSRLVDNLTFETIAFLGVLPTHEFIKQIVFAYFAGLILESILSPLSALIFYRLKNSQFYASA